MDRVHRFLILGSEGGTYYVGEADLTKQNHANVLACIKQDGRAVVDMTVEVSDKGLAPKNEPAIFVLALCVAHGDADVRRYALASLSRVCRIGTHLFRFVDYVSAFRGWVRGLRNGAVAWYTDKNPP